MRTSVKPQEIVDIICAISTSTGIVYSFFPTQSRLTWKTFGALTRLARAEEIVAAKIPAVTSGPNPDIISIT